ncbi:hypothetical protein D3C81_1811390 [compost metagenome]
MNAGKVETTLLHPAQNGAADIVWSDRSHCPHSLVFHQLKIHSELSLDPKHGCCIALSHLPASLWQARLRAPSLIVTRANAAGRKTSPVDDRKTSHLNVKKQYSSHKPNRSRQRPDQQILPTIRLARRHQTDHADTVSADKQEKPNHRRCSRPYANTDSSTRSK